MPNSSGFTTEEARHFVLNHFEEFVNRKNIAIGEVNFAPAFVDHGTDVPPGMPAGPKGAMEYVGHALKMFPDLRVIVEDIVVEGDKVVVRNTWTATDQHAQQISFGGIVIWRIANRQLIERWAYLEKPHAVK